MPAAPGVKTATSASTNLFVLELAGTQVGFLQNADFPTTTQLTAQFSTGMSKAFYDWIGQCVTGTREQFGRPICEFQGLQWKFADMAIKLEGAQLLLYRAAANADKGLPSAYETAVAKAACNQTGFEVAHEAVQIMGAAGYSKSSLVEYCMRRCRGWMIAGGSIEMLKNRIAEHVFDRRFDQRPPKPKAQAAE